MMPSSFSSEIPPIMELRSSIKQAGVIIFCILVVSPVILASPTATMASVSSNDMESEGGCGAMRFDDLYKNYRQPISLAPGIPPLPPVLEVNCRISPYAISWTGFKLFLVTALLFVVPLPLFLFLKRRLSQASCMAYRIIWGFSLFFLIACVTIYVTELEGNRKQILGDLDNATGNWEQCDKLSEAANLEIMSIFLKVNPLNSISKTVQILMTGMERGRQKSRVTKLWKQLEGMGDKEEEEDAN